VKSGSPAFREAPQPGGCSGCGPLLEKDETAIAGGGKAGHCLAEPEVHKSHASRVLHMFGHMKSNLDMPLESGK